MSPTPPPNDKQGPFSLNPARIVLLVMGVLLVIYTASVLLGGPANYQRLKEGAAEQKAVTGSDAPAKN